MTPVTSCHFSIWHSFSLVKPFFPLSFGRPPWLVNTSTLRSRWPISPVKPPLLTPRATTRASVTVKSQIYYLTRASWWERVRGRLKGSGADELARCERSTAGDMWRGGQVLIGALGTQTSWLAGAAWLAGWHLEFQLQQGILDNTLASQPCTQTGSWHWCWITSLCTNTCA